MLKWEVNKTFSPHVSTTFNQRCRGSKGYCEPHKNIRWCFYRVTFFPTDLHGMAALTLANLLSVSNIMKTDDILAHRSFHHIHRSLKAYFISHDLFAAFEFCKCKSSFGQKSKTSSQNFSLGNALSSFEGENKAPILKVSNFKDRRIP